MIENTTVFLRPILFIKYPDKIVDKIPANAVNEYTNPDR